MSQTPNNDGGITNEELAQQLYNVLMREIEPDLLTYNLPKLDEYYAEETATEKAKRMQRYDAAYKKFEQAHRDFMTFVHNEVKKAQQQTLTVTESSSKQHEAKAVEDALQNIHLA